MYTVVEQVCELCGVVNNHLTADCPHATCDRPWVWDTFDALVTFVSSRFDTFMFFAGRLTS